MKNIILALSLAAAGVGSAHAQLFQPAITRDAMLGAVTGALIGGHNHDRWGEGAAMGAAAGALLGATVDQPRRVVYRPAPVVQYVPVASAPQVVYVQQTPAVPVVRVVERIPMVYCAPAPVVFSAPARYYYPGRYGYIPRERYFR